MRATVTVRHTLRPDGDTTTDVLDVEIDETAFLTWINEGRCEPYPSVAVVDQLPEMVAFFLDAGIGAEPNAWNPRYADPAVARTQVVVVIVLDLPPRVCPSTSHTDPVPAVVPGFFDARNGNSGPVVYCWRCAAILADTGMFTPDDADLALPSIEQVVAYEHGGRVPETDRPRLRTWSGEDLG